MKALHGQLDAMEAAAAVRDERVMDSLKSAASADEHIRNQLTTIRNSLEDMSSTPNTTTNEQLEELQQLIEQRFAALQEQQSEDPTLRRIETAVAAQASTLDALAAAKEEAAPLMTREEQHHWAEIRTASTHTVKSITSLVDQFGAAKGSERGRLLSRLKEQLGKLEELDTKESRLHSGSAAKATSRAATSDDVLSAIENMGTRLLQSGAQRLQEMRSLVDQALTKEGKETELMGGPSLRT
ncbi:hypothetical protein STCU_10223 [Strigomonas culicis]|uniref:Uncharacterized protein n=1 Tax=Strigomonas culicis TaxID=28005 RepID=S9TMP8_9TRYP|nr:hypothetical protein STCU_10223 [Strigomonas culicis]|eukprot:EPY18039.1 hypothetical protein STCU_10223 [Strigomonas culicis]